MAVIVPCLLHLVSLLEHHFFLFDLVQEVGLPLEVEGVPAF